MPKPLMKAGARPHLFTLALLVLCSLSLYFWRLEEPKSYIYDEVYHAYTAGQLAAGNRDAYVWYTQVPEQDKKLGVFYEWTHPALSKLLIECGIVLFGNNSFGWRFASAVFGSLGIGILYALGCILFDQVVGLFAALLMTFDGLWFVQARIAMNDVFVACFLMLAYIAFFFYLNTAQSKRWRSLWLTGAALGLALATKWSALYSLGLMGLIAAGRELGPWRTRRDKPSARTLLTIAGCFGVVPLSIYIAGYAQFFTMGHTWSEWRTLQELMWWYHSHLNATHPWMSKWWTWPLLIKPVWYYADYEPTYAANVIALGNPLIWWAFLPAIVYLGMRWRDSGFRNVGLGLVLLGFLGQWLPWSFSPRITYLYHMLPSLPFGCLAIAYTLRQLHHRRRLVSGYLALVLIGFVYFFPQYSAWPVSYDYADQHYWLSSWRPH